MEEEEKNNGAIGAVGDKLKEAGKEQAKRAKKKIIKKVIAALVPILLKFIVILIVVLIVLQAISWVLDLFKSSESKEVFGGALEYSYVAYNGSQTEEERNGYKIIPTVDKNSGGYKLNFKFFDEEKNEISENEVLEDIKNKLNKGNIDYSDFTETNLKIIATLEKNGLDLEKYNKEELKCLPMFIKAEIASQNFDIRNNKDELNLEDILDNDLVYGTMQVQRTSVVESNGETQESHLTLQYMEYEDFKKLEETNNIEEAKKYFSLDEDGNLLVAKWRTRRVEVSYLDENENPLSEDEIAKIPEENKVNGVSENTVTILPIDYKNNINKYSLSYGFLSDLLITTKNASFCNELCIVAFNSKVVIDFREETTTDEGHTDTTYNNIDLTCDYAKYEVRGTHNVSGETTRTQILSGNGYPGDSSDLTSIGWNSNLSQTANGRTITYRWTNNEIPYELAYTGGRSAETSTWILYKFDAPTSSEDLPVQGNINEAGDGEIIIGGQEEGFEQSNYTTKDEWTYIVHVDTYSTNNMYKYEISEVDCWFAKYKKEYDAPEITETPNSNDSTTEGSFENISNESITDQAQIEQKIEDSDVIKSFVESKEQSYKKTYQDAENVECTISELNEYIWEKVNVRYKSSSKTVKYKFGEEKADTTKIELKNISYTDNGPEFDENSKEIGFLSIYDKYLKNGEDLYLKQDAEKMLFEMLEDNEATRVYSDLLKGLLYSYDHIDRGVTDLSSLLDVFKVKDFKTARGKGAAIEEWLKSYEYNDLRELRNGTMIYETFKNRGYRNYTVTMDDDGKMKYRMYHLDVDNENTTDHSWNFSYGLMIRSDANGQNLDSYLLEKVDLSYSELMADPENAWWDADVIDQLFLVVVDNHRKHIRDYYENSGIELESYELDAFIAAAYGHGNCYASADSLDLLRRYKDGNASNEEIINNFHTSSGFYPFMYGGWKGKQRGNALEAMFFEGRYILSTGEEIDPNAFGGSLADWDGDTYVSDNYIFPVYNQHSPQPWATTPFGGPNGRPNVIGNNGQQKTISSSGCGCCSLAAVLSGYLGEAITPDILTEILDATYTDGRYYLPGVGSCNFYFSDSKLLNNFNCRGEVCVSFEQATQALREGYALIGGESGHVLAFVPTSAEDGGLFRIIDSSRGHNFIYSSFEEANSDSAHFKMLSTGNRLEVKAIIYPPGK